jgi:Family of unknown function (DUF6011)
VKPWHGQHVVVWSRERWEFYRCVHCDKLLDEAASRRRGFGPDCWRAVRSDVLRESEREQALAADRERWRREHPRRAES